MEEQKLDIGIEEKSGDGLMILEDLVDNVATFSEFSYANLGTSILNEMKPVCKAIRSTLEIASSLLNSFAKVISEIEIPKIEFPVFDENTRRHFKFVGIASTIGFPVFFETDTELEYKTISICEDYQEECYPLEELKQCIYEYYDHNMLMKMLDMWCDQEWILYERRKALKEAIEVYEKGYYFSAASIIMCQLGGLINELYDATDFSSLMTLEERKNINELFDVRKIDSEKAKVLQMMSMQDSGVFQWYESAEYMMNHTYSSTEDSARFEHDPGRHKICHGEQTNYGTKEHALKAILVADIVIQLGEQMLQSEGINA